jgi:hypothetical protein
MPTILMMKEFNLFYVFGVLTRNVTNGAKHKHVVETVSQIRGRLLNDQTFRTPILSLFKGIYEDGSEFPEEPKESTPPIDHMKIHSHPPSDDDVVEFLTNSFPDLYMINTGFSPNDLLLDGQEKLKKEEILISFFFCEALAGSMCECEIQICTWLGLNYFKGIINPKINFRYGIIIYVHCYLVAWTCPQLRGLVH